MIKLKVSELFFSLQGEGPLVGCPTFFIRVFGCNLDCKWCDTPYAKEKENGYLEIEVSEIINLWEKEYPEIPYITITGGEPLLQKEVYFLIENLLSKKAVICLETNGSLSVEKVPEEVIKIVDFKPPSSGMEKFNFYENLNFLSKKDVLKFVIQDRKDFNWALNKIEEFRIFEITQVFFSPAVPFLTPQTLAQWILETKKPIRFQFQLHKFLNLK